MEPISEDRHAGDELQDPAPKEDKNFLHILREMMMSKGPKDAVYDDTGHKEEGADRGFSVILHTASAISTLAKAMRGGKPVGSGKQPASYSGVSTANLKFTQKTSSEKSPSEDYQKAYLRKKYAQQNEARGNAVADADKAAFERKEKEEETTLRVRARDLTNQIVWWRSQLGTGAYEQNYITGMITTLEHELRGIAPKYWS